MLASESFEVLFYISIFDPFWVIIEHMRYRLRIIFFSFAYGCQVFLPELFDKNVIFSVLSCSCNFLYGSLSVCFLCVFTFTLLYLCLPASNISSVPTLSPLFWFSLPFSLFLSPCSKWNVWVNIFSLKDFLFTIWRMSVFSTSEKWQKWNNFFTVTQFFSVNLES